MERIGSFVNSATHDLFFNGCTSCEGICCNGRKGFAASPLILEDFEMVYRHFAIVFSFDHEGELGVYVMLNDGKGHCIYFSDNRCTIYEQRTPACRLYPVSSYFEHILIDTACPSVSQNNGIPLCQNGILNPSFYTQRLENFVAKRKATKEFLEQMNHEEGFVYCGEVLGLPLFQYARQSDNPYIIMHQMSLQHLKIGTLG